MKQRKNRLIKTRKVPGALDPAVALLPFRVKKYCGHSRYEPKWCSRSLRRIFVWPREKPGVWG